MKKSLAIVVAFLAFLLGAAGGMIFGAFAGAILYRMFVGIYPGGIVEGRWIIISLAVPGIMFGASAALTIYRRIMKRG